VSRFERYDLYKIQILAGIFSEKTETGLVETAPDLSPKGDG
jgi:hypothetical protein